MYWSSWTKMRIIHSENVILNVIPIVEKKAIQTNSLETQIYMEVITK